MGRALLVLNTDFDKAKATHWVSKAPLGTRVEFKASKRSLPQNDRLWAMLTDVQSHMKAAGKDFTTDQWKAIFMHACGKEVSFLPSLDGKTFLPWGQSSSDLSKQEMTDLIEFIFAWGAENGIKFNEPIEQEPSSDIPSSDDEGSGATVPIGAAADPFASLGDEGEEADAGFDTAMQASSPDPVSANLLAECLDKFMALATDERLTVQQRRDNLEFAKEPWKEALPTRHDFVKACLTTADKVAKGELGAGAARRYLEGVL